MMPTGPLLGLGDTPLPVALAPLGSGQARRLLHLTPT